MAILGPSVSFDGRPHNLPLQVTRLLGREAALHAVRGLVLRDDVRLVTLTGAGGSGKTRLGLQAVTELLNQFEDGAFFVDLSPISDPGLVVSTIARTFELRDTIGRPLLDGLIDFLRRRRLLLLLDNFEQILAAAPTVAALIKSCPSLSVLVTSRAPLQIDGENEFPVPPLALPDSSGPMTPDHLSHAPAVALFVERATAIRPDFVVTSTNAPVVAEICRRLDGLPLAIELAAARTRLMSPEAIQSRLGRVLGLLVGGRRDQPARQQTLRSTIAWSYDLLAPAEQVLCRRLGVFVGGFTFEAAEAVCDVDGALGVGVLDGIGSLVEKSILRPDGANGEPRFGMLETIREYALERADQSGEMVALRRSHADYFLTLAEQAEPHLLRAGDSSWLRQLQEEHDNLRAALTWCLIDDGDVGIGVRIAAAVARFWHLRSYVSEGLRWIELALASRDETLVPAQAKALTSAGWLAHELGDLRRAAALFEQAADLYRRLEDRRGLALAIGDRGVIMEHQGEYQQAEVLIAESLDLYRQTGDQEGVADRLRGLGSVACAQGDFARATVLLEENLALCRQFGGTFRVALAVGALGLAALYQGDVERGLGLFQECLTQYRQLERHYGIAWALQYLARLELLRGDVNRAADLLMESLSSRVKLDDTSGIAQCLEGIAAAGLARGLTEPAIRLLGAAAHLRETNTAPLSPAERVGFDQDVATGRVQIGEAAFAALWADGHALPFDRVIEAALELARVASTGDKLTSRHRGEDDRMSSLTPRECEVAALIARGLTNPEIAAELVIAPRTADTHVRNILGKLDLANRAQIAAWASRQGLV